MRFVYSIPVFIVGFLFAAAVVLVTQGSPELAIRDNGQEVIVRPEEIAIKFVELAGSNRYDELSQIATYSPYGYSSLKKISTSEPKHPRGVKLVTIREDGDEKRREIWIEDAESIHRNAQFSSSIRQVWVRDDNARVRLVLRSRRSGVRSVESDFLLIKENGNWKVFAIVAPV